MPVYDLLILLIFSKWAGVFIGQIVLLIGHNADKGIELTFYWTPLTSDKL